MLKDFNRRMTVAIIPLVCVIFLILFAFSGWFQYVVAFSVATLTGVALWEFGQLAKAKGGNVAFPVLIGAGFLEVFSFFVAARFPNWEFLPIAIFFLGFLVLFALHLREKEGALINLSTSSFGLLYVAIPMGMILGILYQGGQDGRWWVAYLLFVTKITDVGAYFAGSLWGKRKLAPQISPGKTVEGALFGLVCAVAASYGIHFISQSVKEWFLLGLILGVVAQFSDLAESLLKRDANKKDSNAIPGLGGVLDIVDSLLFNAPIVYLYLLFIKS